MTLFPKIQAIKGGKLCLFSYSIAHKFLGVHVELQIFDDAQDVEVTVAYPTVGQGKFTVTYAEALVIAQVKILSYDF